MSRKLTKAQKRKKKTQQRNKKIKKMESQDVKGISRKKITGTMDPKLFIIIKIISGLLILFAYIFFSPLLLVAIIFNALMIIFAHKTEKKINHTFIKSNHMHILKLDSIVSILVILITIAGVAITTNSKKHIDSNNISHEIVETIKNTGSCLTGNRSLLGGGLGMHFGTKDFDPSKMPNNMQEPPKMKEIDMSNIPLDILLSKMVSSINTIMIFMIPVLDGITIYCYFRKKKKFDKEMNEVIYDDSILTDQEFEKLFMFGYEEL